MTDESNIFPSEIIAKIDSIKFNVSEYIGRGLYDDIHAKSIIDDLEKISLFVHSSYCQDIQDLVLRSLPRLAQNLQRHRISNLLEPYEPIFNDNFIKVRSFPSSILSMDDSETISGFYKQLQSTLIFLKSERNISYGFSTLHSLNFSISKILSIMTSLMENQGIDDFYYLLLNQTSENLINLQNLLNLAKKMENDSNAILDLNTLLLRKLPEIEVKIGTKVLKDLNVTPNK